MKKGKYRVKWYNRQGLIREEWFFALRNARLRVDQLKSGGYEAIIYEEQSQ